MKKLLLSLNTHKIGLVGLIALILSLLSNSAVKMAITSLLQFRHEDIVTLISSVITIIGGVMAYYGKPLSVVDTPSEAPAQK